VSDVTGVLVPGKIGAVHLGRDAYVYVRQSTLTRSGAHRAWSASTSSRERAVALMGRPSGAGYRPDLGCSVRATAREGFKGLVADVGRAGSGRPGIEVRGRPVTTPTGSAAGLRALTDTLIGDADGVYHRATSRPRIGLKGTMSGPSCT
jgi:hypothetical protein